MATAKITLICDSGTADGTLYTRGALRIVPSFTRLGDAADQVLIEQAGVRVTFPECDGPPSADLFPCDLIGPQDDDGPGWCYTVYYDGCPGNPPPWSFLLLSTDGSTQRLSGLAPADTPASPWGYVASFNGRTGPVTAQAGDYTAGQVGADAAGAAASAQAAAQAYADAVKLAKSADLSDLASATTARANLGLGTAATQPSSAFDAAGAAASEAARAEAAEAVLAVTLSPFKYGAKGDGAIAYDGAITTGTAILTSAALQPFSGTRTAWITGAGPGHGVLQTTITCTAAGTATLGANASFTVTGAVIYWGTDDTAALQATMTAAFASITSGSAFNVAAHVELQAGCNYLVSAPIIVVTNNGGASPQAVPGITCTGSGGLIGDQPPRNGQAATALIALPAFPAGSFLVDYQQAPATTYGPAGARVGGFTLDCQARAAGFRAQGSREFRIQDLTIASAAAPVTPGDSANGAFSMTYITPSGGSAGAYNRVDHVTVWGAAADGFWDDTNNNNLYTGCVSQAAAACYHIGSAAQNIYLACVYVGGTYGWEIEHGGAALVIGTYAFAGGPFPSSNCVLLAGGKGGLSNDWATTFQASVLINDPPGSAAEAAGATVYAKVVSTYLNDATFAGCYFGTGPGGHTTDWAYSDAGIVAGSGILFDGCTFSGSPTTAVYDDKSKIFTFARCRGVNPLGALTIPVPASGTVLGPWAADTVWYVTAGAGGLTMTVSNGPAVPVPDAGLTSVFVPAGQTVTPTFTSAPTWEVAGL